jgi:hypothetical protein
MEHVGEILDDRGANLLERTDASEGTDEEERFYGLLEYLLKDPEKTRKMAAVNHRVASSGRLSVQQRNAALRKIYLEALDAPAEDCLALGELESRDNVTLTLSSTRVSEAHRALREKYGITRLNFYNAGTSLQASRSRAA